MGARRTVAPRVSVLGRIQNYAISEEVFDLVDWVRNTIGRVEKPLERSIDKIPRMIFFNVG